MNALKSNTVVFNISCALAFLFLLWGGLAPDHLSTVTGALQTSLLDSFGWLYVSAASSFLICALCLIFSRWGDIPLGPDDAKPEFNLLTWFAMLFCAGMGIGLVFWGVAEPTSHFHDPPFGEGGTSQAARLALQYSFFHWGLHPWGIYTMVALALAYFQFRKGTPGLFSLGCQPVLGKYATGPLGTAVDVVAVFATVFGVATSLGFGAVQISGGLFYVFGISNSLTTQLVLIAIVTVLFMLSAQTGLQRGIKYLSNLNMIFALSLLFFLLFLGPTHFIMTVFPSTFGHYLQNLPTMSLNLAPFGDSTWIHDWTLFYWAWWIAWAPFVGYIYRENFQRPDRAPVRVRCTIGALALLRLLVYGLWRDRDFLRALSEYPIKRSYGTTGHGSLALHRVGTISHGHNHVAHCHLSH